MSTRVRWLAADSVRLTYIILMTPLLYAYLAVHTTVQKLHAVALERMLDKLADKVYNEVTDLTERILGPLERV